MIKRKCNYFLYPASNCNMLQNITKCPLKCALFMSFPNIYNWTDPQDKAIKTVSSSNVRMTYRWHIVTVGPLRRCQWGHVSAARLASGLGGTVTFQSHCSWSCQQSATTRLFLQHKQDTKWLQTAERYSALTAARQVSFSLHQLQ